jgi:YVTN family beta-propeller protein
MERAAAPAAGQHAAAAGLDAGRASHCRGGRRGLRLALALALLCATGAARADTIGAVVDQAGEDIIVFNADTGDFIGSITLPGNGDVGDVLVLPDQSKAFVTRPADQDVIVIDLTTDPPELAGAPNPIEISTTGFDLALSADRKFLLASAALDDGPISVISLATLEEVEDPFDTEGNFDTSVETCSTGDVLVTTTGPNAVLKLALDGDGALSAADDTLTLANAANVYCAPDGQSGVALAGPESDGTPELQSFLTADMSGVDNLERPAMEFPIAGGFHPSGELFYFRTGTDEPNTPDRFEAFAYEPRTGEIGRLLKSVTLEGVGFLRGSERLAVHPDGTRLYVPQPGSIVVLDAKTLAVKSTITLSGLSDPTAISLSSRSGEIDVAIAAVPFTGLGWLHPLRSSLSSVTLFGSAGFNAAQVDDATVRLVGSRKPLRAGVMDDVDDDGTPDRVLFFRSSDIKLGSKGKEFCIRGKAGPEGEDDFIGCQWLRADP